MGWLGWLVALVVRGCTTNPQQITTYPRPTHVARVPSLFVASQRNISMQDIPKPVFWDVPWYLIINTAIGGGWPGPPNGSTLFPVHHAVDYVRVSRLQMDQRDSA